MGLTVALGLDAAMLLGVATEGLAKLVAKRELAAAAWGDRLPLAAGVAGGGDRYAALGVAGEVVVTSGSCCVAAGEGDEEGEAREEAEGDTEDAVGEAAVRSPVVFLAAAAAIGDEVSRIAACVLLVAAAGMGARLPEVALEPAAGAPVLAVLLEPASACLVVLVLLEAVSAGAPTTAMRLKPAVLLEPTSAALALTVMLEPAALLEPAVLFEPVSAAAPILAAPVEPVSAALILAVLLPAAPVRTAPLASV